MQDVFFVVDIWKGCGYNGHICQKGVCALYYTTMDSPLGEVLLVSDGTCLTRVCITHPPEPDWQRQEELPVFCLARKWLEDYFSGIPRRAEELPLKAEGTVFQKTVWQILSTIPWGQTRTYGDIAKEVARILGKKKMSAQAVGQAVGKNPLWIIIPCHRCIGAGGKLTGYAGGLDKKAWLLRHEEEHK